MKLSTILRSRGKKSLFLLGEGSNVKVLEVDVASEEALAVLEKAPKEVPIRVPSTAVAALKVSSARLRNRFLRELFSRRFDRRRNLEDLLSRENVDLVYGADEEALLTLIPHCRGLWAEAAATRAIELESAKAIYLLIRRVWALAIRAELPPQFLLELLQRAAGQPWIREGVTKALGERLLRLPRETVIELLQEPEEEEFAEKLTREFERQRWRL